MTYKVTVGELSRNFFAR